MIQLTTEQLKELIQSEATLVRAMDPATNTEYVVLRADVYERFLKVLDLDIDVVGSYTAIDRAFAEGWSDPKMNDYDRYEELKQ